MNEKLYRVKALEWSEHVIRNGEPMLTTKVPYDSGLIYGIEKMSHGRWCVTIESEEDKTTVEAWYKNSKDEAIASCMDDTRRELCNRAIEEVKVVGVPAFTADGHLIGVGGPLHEIMRDRHGPACIGIAQSDVGSIDDFSSTPEELAAQASEKYWADYDRCNAALAAQQKETKK